MPNCVRMRRRDGPSIKHGKEQSALRGSHTYIYWTLATPSAPAGRRKRRSRNNGMWLPMPCDAHQQLISEGDA